jgi:drug/metabolite transporter (DMT)-like permease
MVAAPTQLGTLALTVSGMANTGILLLGRVLSDDKWPYYRILATSCLINAFITAVFLKVIGAKCPPAAMIKWLILRPLFGSLSLVASILAVQAGTPLGDVAALGSINIVAAAFLSHLFLQERLRRLHMSALVLSTIGAVLVARPSFLFPAQETASLPWWGYVLSLLSGLFDAGSFVCSRKSVGLSEDPGIEIGFVCFAAQLICSLILYALGSTSLVQDHSFWIVIQSPWEALAYLGSLLSLAWMYTLFMVAGSCLCSAAVSTTVYTSSTVGSGYAAQMLLFDEVPEPLTVGGAGLLLAAVIIMVCTRKSHTQISPDGFLEAGTIPSSPPVAVTVTEEPDSHQDESTPDDDQESITSFATFVATEFAVSTEPTSSTRFRGASKTSSAVAVGKPWQPNVTAVTVVAMMPVVVGTQENQCVPR